IHLYQDLFCALLYVCEVLAGCVSAKKMVRVFKNINEVDNMLRSLKINISYKKTYLYILAYTSVVFVGICVLFVCLVTTKAFLICYAYRTQHVLMEAVSYCLPFVANFLMQTQYFQCLNILKLSISHLLALERVATITEVIPKLPKPAEASTLFTINHVTRIHMLLTSTSRLVNESFCFQHLLKICMSFISTVTGLFLFAMVFAIKDSSKLDFDLLFFMWTVCNAFEVFVVVWISAGLCKEANYCPIILHRIRNCNADDKVKSLIDLHSLQMFHSKLTFSVCGLFPLDYSLLYSVVAGATTYLVILMQFNIDMVKTYNNGTMY
ncbi:hypothetical protein NQ315_005543, partial [Exocentrus adspersus]